MKNPLTPLLAASIAAYSRRRVESDVQYCIVAGGGGGVMVSSGGEEEGGEVDWGRTGNWKNL
jgi:hypothetical protein